MKLMARASNTASQDIELWIKLRSPRPDANGTLSKPRVARCKMICTACLLRSSFVMLCSFGHIEPDEKNAGQR